MRIFFQFALQGMTLLVMWITPSLSFLCMSQLVLAKRVVLRADPKLTYVPQNITVDVTDLDLARNAIQILTNNSFHLFEKITRTQGVLLLQLHTSSIAGNFWPGNEHNNDSTLRESYIWHWNFGFAIFWWFYFLKIPLLLPKPFGLYWQHQYSPICPIFKLNV